MARFKPPQITRPPVDGQMRGEYGDSVPGAIGVDRGSYHARLWLGTSKGQPYQYTVYALGGELQIWTCGQAIAKVKALRKTARTEAAVAAFSRFLGHDGLVQLRAVAEANGTEFYQLRVEKHLATKRKPSLRWNIWTAAHRVAATCLVGIERDDLPPMDEAHAFAYRAKREEKEGVDWAQWWASLSDWAKVYLSIACRFRIRDMLDNRDGHDRDVAWWLSHFATFDWRGRDHGYALRPAAGGSRRSCFSVLLAQWIHPRSNVTAQALALMTQRRRSVSWSK